MTTMLSLDLELALDRQGEVFLAFGKVITTEGTGFH